MKVTKCHRCGGSGKHKDSGFPCLMCKGKGEIIERRGGRRAGCGQKPKYGGGALVIYSVKITHAQAELLKEWGGGDISMGLRWLVDTAEVLVRRNDTHTTPSPLT